MAAVLDSVEQPPLVVHTSPVVEMDDEQFFQFCQLNRELRIERTAEGDLIIMPPTGGSGSRGNAELTYLFQSWAHRDGTGQVFDSSGGVRIAQRCHALSRCLMGAQRTPGSPSSLGRDGKKEIILSADHANEG